MSKLKHQALIDTLQQRFARHPARHPGLEWAAVLARLQTSPRALAALAEMDNSGGEPDVVLLDGEGRAQDPAGPIHFCDCSPESPAGRRSLCYDRAALDARKLNKPAGSAVQTAEAWGMTLLTEAQYRQLQTLGEFDLKTSSWLHTPPEVRSLGGALFGDRRFGRVFTYHNGAESYYAGRGFRGCLRL